MSDFIRAGNTAVRKAVMINKALADNKPKYGKMAEQAVLEEAKNRANAATNNSKTAAISMNAEGLLEKTDIKIDRDNSIRNSNKKARMTGLLAGGVAMAGIGVMKMNEKQEPNEQLSLVEKMMGSYDQRSSDAAAELERLKGLTYPGSDSPATEDAPTNPAKPTAASTNSPAGDGSAAPGNFKGIVDMAQQSGAKYPELVAAQWALESGYGKTPSGKNNYFGIKATPSEASTSKPTWEVINGKEENTTAPFKDFETPQASVNDLVSKWYKDYDGYSGVNRAGSASEAADLLVTENYATDPNYGSKLKDILRTNGY